LRPVVRGRERSEKERKRERRKSEEKRIETDQREEVMTEVFSLELIYPEI
jgi:hypothetical protein